ncbi:hypothetical protein [Cellulomonas sp. ICMP 17802]|uniref:hypothetical protein n=1 Tax=Cellulomonas sp. ICMP 17802 TaxID=3239199 RepID=UPI00351B616E
MARAGGSTAKDVQVTRLVGPPGAVVGVVDVPPDQRTSIVLVPPATRKPDAVLSAVRVLTAPAGPARTEVRLLLPDDAPPGERTAQLLWDGGAIDVRIEVLGSQAVEVRPLVVPVVAPAGSITPVSVHAVNRGNVPVEIGKVAVLAFEERETLEHAIVAGLSGKATGLDRWAVVADTVAARQSEAARVVVTQGAGSLAPGADAWVVGEVHVPAGLSVAEHAGTWVVAGVRVRIEVQVTAPPPAPRTRSTRAKESS